MGIVTQISRCVQLGDRLFGDPTFRTRAEIFAGQEKKLGYKSILMVSQWIGQLVVCLPFRAKGKICWFIVSFFLFIFGIIFFFFSFFLDKGRDKVKGKNKK